jgi:DNA modification methylase
LDLLKELLPKDISQQFLLGVSETASFVIPLLLLKQGDINTVVGNALRFLIKLECKEIETHLTLMDVIRIKKVIEEKIGKKLEKKYTKEIDELVNYVENTVIKKKYNVITLENTEKGELIKCLTLLLCVLNVTILSKVDLAHYLIYNFFLTISKLCFRVLKPGGYLLSFGGTRTFHRIACAIEDAGFEFRDTVAWLYGQGFPKSLDVSKAIDSEIKSRFISDKIKYFRENRGMTRFELGTFFGAVDPEKTIWDWEEGGHNPAKSKWLRCKELLNVSDEEEKQFEREVIGKGKSGENSYFGCLDGSEGYDVTAPASEEAKEWQGWGTALKPAFEPILVFRKPLIGTVAENVLEWGTGALNIDACRISLNGENPPTDSAKRVFKSNQYTDEKIYGNNKKTPSSGRFSANVILSHSPECKLIGTKKVKPAGGDIAAGSKGSGPRENEVYGKDSRPRGEWKAYKDEDGMETIEAWECVDDCPIKILDKQSQNSKATKPYIVNSNVEKYEGYGTITRKHGEVINYDEPGAVGASRFFYCAKASKKERNFCCEEVITWESVDLNLELEELNQLLKDISADTMQKIKSFEWSTMLFGKMSLEQSQKDMRFIIEMVLKLIIELKTLDSKMILNIREYILDAIRMLMENGLNLVENVENINQLKQDTIKEEMVLVLGVVLVVLKMLWRIKEKGKKGNVHSTVKPLALLEYFIKLTTAQDAIILDPFAGSGSTLIAAKKLGRRCLGIEKEREYCEISAARIKGNKHE